MSVPTTIAATQMTVPREVDVVAAVAEHKRQSDAANLSDVSIEITKNEETSPRGAVQRACIVGAAPAVGAILAWILVGTLFYTFYEGWNVGAGFYYAIQAGLSVGFGALVELDDGSRLFTIFYVLMGSSAVAGALSVFAQLALEKHESMMKEIQRALCEGSDAAGGNAGGMRSLARNCCVEFWHSQRNCCIALGLFIWYILLGTVFAMTKMVPSFFTRSFSLPCCLQNTTFITGLYFAVTACSTGGLYAPTCGQGDYCFALVGLYCLFGIPLFGYSLGQFANIFVEKYSRYGHHASEIRSRD